MPFHHQPESFATSQSEEEQRESFLLLETRTRVFRTVLELAPCAIAIWNTERSSCILNHAARQMTGFSEGDLLRNQSLWIERVHPQDQQSFLAAWKELQTREKKITRDYRFLPNGKKKAIMVRDSSVSHRNSNGKIGTIISSYTDISDLRVNHQESRRSGTAEHIVKFIRPLIHEIQNDLQLIKMGVDLVYIDSTKPLGPRSVADGIERLNKLSGELGVYLVPPRTQLSAEQPEILLEEVVHEMEEKLHDRGIRVRIVRRSPLPIVRLDSVQFRSALKRVMEFCQELLPQGGELEIEARPKTINGQGYIEFRIVGSSPFSLEIEEKNAFQPFLEVNNIQIGLSMAIAQQILRRHQGKIFFRKENPQRGLVTILLKICSD